MIDTKPPLVVETSGDFKEKSFRISDDNVAHILGILRNQLYADKIGAVVREYICNALDAQKESDETRKIMVGCPTHLSPFFTVRDWGAGMDEETIFTLFTSYGDSTKRASNNYVGMYGIGSKSAFAYTDQFNVISYCKGVKSVYSCYIDESHKGKVALLTSEPSDDPSGIEINVPVKAPDFSRFLTAIQAFMNWSTLEFDVQGADIQKNIYPITAEGEDWFIFTSPKNEPFKVIMGHVAYPIDLNQLRPIMDDNGGVFRFENLSTYYTHNCVAIRAPIGELDISASRESLQYTKKTIAYLRLRLKLIGKELKEQSQKLFAKCKNIVQATMVYHRDELILLRALGDHLMWTDPGTGQTHQLSDRVMLRHIHEYVPGCIIRAFSITYHQKMREQSGHHTAVPVSRHPIVLLAPVNLHRLRDRIDASRFTFSPHSTFYLLQADEAVYPLLVQLFEGYVKVQDLRTVEPPARTVTVSNGTRYNPKVSCYLWDFKTQDWLETSMEMEEDKPVIYVPLLRFFIDKPSCPAVKWKREVSVRWRKEWEGPSTSFLIFLKEWITPLLKELKMDVENFEFVGVKVGSLGSVPKTWLRIDDWMVSLRDELVRESPELIEDMEWVFTGKSDRVHGRITDLVHEYLTKKLGKQHPVVRYSRRIRRIDYLRNSKHTLWKVLSESFFYQKENLEKEGSLSKAVDVIKHYPLIEEYIVGNSNKIQVRHMVLYIKELDRLRNAKLKKEKVYEQK